MRVVDWLDLSPVAKKGSLSALQPNWEAETQKEIASLRAQLRERVEEKVGFAPIGRTGLVTLRVCIGLGLSGVGSLISGFRCRVLECSGLGFRASWFGFVGDSGAIFFGWFKSFACPKASKDPTVRLLGHKFPDDCISST